MSLFNWLWPTLYTKFLCRASPRAKAASELGKGPRSSLPAGAGRPPRIADVDRIHGDHDNADFGCLKANVHEMFLRGTVISGKNTSSTAGAVCCHISEITNAVRIARFRPLRLPERPRAASIRHPIAVEVLSPFASLPTVKEFNGNPPYQARSISYIFPSVSASRFPLPRCAPIGLGGGYGRPQMKP